MNLTEMEDRAARARRGKFEVKLWLVALVMLMIVLLVVIMKLV